jgi:phytanoyl-CoA hydroxylase
MTYAMATYYQSNMEMEQAKFYNENGFLVVKGMFPKMLCNNLLKAFHHEIKPSNTKMLRQASGVEETHCFSKAGYMTNSLLDLHTFSQNEFPLAIKSIYDLLGFERLSKTLGELLNEDPLLIQTMYFESSDFGTLVHIDGAILDSSIKGDMIGWWIALEDIEESSGRFFVSPGSNKLGTDAFSDAVNGMYRQFYKCLHDQYHVAQSKNSSTEYLQLALNRRKLINQIFKATQLELVYPALCAGDILFFSSKTLHGSNKPTSEGKSRNSITAHFIPVSQKLMRFDMIEEKLEIETINNLKVHKSNYYSLPQQRN